MGRAVDCSHGGHPRVGPWIDKAEGFQRFEPYHSATGQHRALSLVIIGVVTLLATVLHAVEAALWAVAFQLLNAVADFKSAMLYSLNAVTSYGHTNLDLAQHWYLLGALEALNGWLLFGLTTAFLFAVIDKLWMPENK